MPADDLGCDIHDPLRTFVLCGIEVSLYFGTLDGDDGLPTRESFIDTLLPIRQSRVPLNPGDRFVLSRSWHDLAYPLRGGADANS